MVDVPDVPVEQIEKALDDALTAVLPADLGARPHLARAVIAQRLAAVANHRSHAEVTAACERDATSWEDVAHAFGISPETARQRFRTAPMGLPG
jgi:hypothetical protein